jgi:hypothetical protein
MFPFLLNIAQLLLVVVTDIVSSANIPHQMVENKLLPKIGAANFNPKEHHHHNQPAG